MNPFVYTEFWLGFAFFIVLGMIIFSPVRQLVRKSLLRQKELIQDKINQSNAVYKEALSLHKKTFNNFKNTPKDQEIIHQIRAIKKEFVEKEKMQTENKNQNFQIQKMLLTDQAKNLVRTQLLEKTTSKIQSSKRPKHVTSQEIQHFMKVLRENTDFLNQNL